jgi:hypothetical protein
MIGNVWYHADSGELGYNIEDAEAPLLPTRDNSTEGDRLLLNFGKAPIQAGLMGGECRHNQARHCHGQATALPYNPEHR